MQLSERVRSTLTNLPPSPLLDRATVVDVLLDLLNASEDPEERRRVEHSLANLPRSVVVDRITVTDALLDLLVQGEPSPN